MKLTNGQLVAFANALEMLSPSMGRSQQAVMIAQGQTVPRLPPVRGNLSYPILAYRVGRAKIVVVPLIRALQEAEQTQLAATRIAPEKKEGEPMPAEETWPSDGRKFAEAMKPILAEEIDLGEIKSLTWDILKKAGVIGGTPAGENEIEFDGSFVAALGDFLAGEPPDE